MIPPSSLVTLSLGNGFRLSSTARVQRGPSEAARCASTEDHQTPSPPPPSNGEYLPLSRHRYTLLHDATDQTLPTQPLPPAIRLPSDVLCAVGSR